MEARKIRSFVDDAWEKDIVPQLVDYIRIPNKSPAFDKDWHKAGHMRRAVDLIAGWCRAQPIEGLTVEVVELEGRTPLIYMEVPGDGDGSRNSKLQSGPPEPHDRDDPQPPSPRQPAIERHPTRALSPQSPVQPAPSPRRDPSAAA